jgi:hypothetical protein
MKVTRKTKAKLDARRWARDRAPEAKINTILWTRDWKPEATDTTCAREMDGWGRCESDPTLTRDKWCVLCHMRSADA